MVGAVGGSCSNYTSPAWALKRPGQAGEVGETAPVEASTPAQDNAGGQQSSSSGGVRKLSREEEQTVLELKQRDAEVRRHEAAHMAAGGGITGGASFSYQVGPDGQSYAVGGEVSVDTSGASTPEATIQKMQTVRRAALAPADPSGQDRAVAAAASAAEAQARMEMLTKSQPGSGNGDTANPSEALTAYQSSSAMPKQRLSFWG